MAVTVRLSTDTKVEKGEATGEYECECVLRGVAGRGGVAC